MGAEISVKFRQGDQYTNLAGLLAEILDISVENSTATKGRATGRRKGWV